MGAAEDRKVEREAKRKLLRERREAQYDRRLTAGMIEDLYYDFASRRRNVYWINFLRGLAFGLGVFLGGTVVVAILVAIIAWLANFFPSFADFFNWLIDAMSKK